ncbi:MAG: 4Fe-4S ferredoxin [Thermotogae bacterium]|uniref:4Fe-4S dicluster domain-containing protein n=1 Tax=Kosmotoga arenicorallina TaxID=688066 RepID=A0A7C5HXX8_9BACT|nr:4Fe-4S dicluster domain-containing protein [Kosmotoga sp.]MBO8167281.1 4Fe-4S dicluster domain-containing protein [Kosmotoga sp.]MCD6159349.1 4Fe-4S dicluster domain-containing protein [Kosmotoga sp.]RKX48079.1 MAG: 4Fe-4S ferredoxin [Thermotogota bacterium]HHF08333.1 4Fe-4S dicluster domain-containing protein [Kosmotoga arenicorallina]
MKTPKLRELKEAITNVFSKRFTTTYPFTTYEAPEVFRGKPVYNDEICIGCGACAQVCPAKAIELKDDLKKGIRILTVRYTDCIYCGQCQEKCITDGGIVLTNDYVTASLDRSDEINSNSVEKKLVRCEKCGTVIATVDHLKWLIKKLGPYTYGHPNLMLIRQSELSTTPAKIRPKEIVRREDHFELLCPKCRHLVVVEDAFK